MQFVKIMSALMLLVALISSLCYSQVNKAMSREDQVQNKLASMSSAAGPGIQYVVTNKAGVLYEHSSGLADVKNNTPLSLRHAMAAFSMTKTLTAIAILQLAEQGMLDIDAPVSRYIKHPYDQGIAIRQLLCHTSGIPNPVPLKWVHLAKDHQGFNEPAALEQVLKENSELNNPPGEKYGYSNIDYWMLGGVIESVSGEGYSAYIRKNILQRLNVSSNEIDFDYSEAAPHAKGYLEKYSFMNLIKSFVTDKAVWGDYEDNWLHIKEVYVNGPAFGGAIGTARAFSAILRDLLAERSILLNNESRELLFTTQKTRSGKEINMTLGWHVRNLDGTRYFYKEGGGAGFHSEMRLYRSQGLASVLMTNQTSFNTRKALNKLDISFLKH
jgi:CubicO group peptidase (beta-lactamase class C family)